MKLNRFRVSSVEYRSLEGTILYFTRKGFLQEKQSSLWDSIVPFFLEGKIQT